MRLPDLHIGPILCAMRRNRFGALLISAQIALVLAFVVNAFTLMEHRIAWTGRPSGVDEDRLFVVESQSLAPHADAPARVAADLAALRTLEGVEVALTNDYPFEGSGWSHSVNLKADQNYSSAAVTSYYFADLDTLRVFGLKLVAGRNFLPDEIVDLDGKDLHIAGSIIVSRALADTLFPAHDALGHSIYVEDDHIPQRIIGIVDELQGPFPAASGRSSMFIENSVIAPYRDVTGKGQYLVRAAPGRVAELMRRAEAKLLALDADRIVEARSLLEARAHAHRGDHGLVLLLVCVCVSLLMVTGFGIVGLTSFWVAQRRRQIGIRRALGARRQDIVQYFQTENLIISTAGALAGIGFALALNIWMVRSFEMSRMDLTRALTGALVIMVLGQLAVFWPALRAATVPPALAARGH